MNGILVMDCVQTAYRGRYGAYGADEKVITIARRKKRSGNPSGGFSAALTGPVWENYTGGPSGKQAGGSLKAYPASFSGGPVKRRPAIPAGASADRPDKIGTGRNKAGLKSRRPGKKAAPALRILILALLITAMTAGFQIMTGASSRPRQQAWKYHTTVTIPWGETMDDVVDRWWNSTYYETREDFVKEICQINSLPFQRGKTPDLGAGIKIVIPYYSTEYK